jgi:hypothetical protein
MSETKHEAVLQQVFTHPISHTIEWRELLAALKSIGKVEEASNGKYHFSHSGRTLTLDSPGAKDVNEEEILRLRQFLHETGHTIVTATPINSAIIIVTHDDVSVFRSLPELTLTEEYKTEDLHGYRRHLHHKGLEHDNPRQPDEDVYYHAVADALTGIERIVLIRNAAGSSSSGELFLREFKKRQHVLAEKIGSELRLDLEAMTVPQLIEAGIGALQEKTSIQ